MINLKQIFLVISIVIPTFVYASTDDLIPGKHQILKDTKVIINDNKFHQVKLFMKDGVFEFRSVEYNKLIPGYRFKKDPIEIETYEAVFLDSEGEQLYQVNIGNPLLVKAQHIGFEDSEFFYGYDNQASFYVPYPKNIEPASLVMYKVFLNTKDQLQTVAIR
jgi:hypothetical protein